MSWLISKLTGHKTADPVVDSPPVSAPNSPPAKQGAVLHFAPARPTESEPATNWTLPADTLGGGSEVCRAIVSLYMQQCGSAMEMKFASALLVLIKSAPFTYEFKIVNKDKVLITQPLVPSLTFYFKPPTHTLVWNMSLAGSVHALVVCFASDDDELNLKSFWNLSYMESGVQHVQASKLGDGDQKWAIQASDAMDIDDEPMEDEYDYDEKEEDRLSMSEFPASSSIRVGGDADQDDVAASMPSDASSSSATNNNLAVGMRLNRTFVNRGSQIGVFKHDESGSLQYLNNVPVVKDMSGAAFAPSKMMLHDEDGKMMLLNPNEQGTVYEMDLEYGKVVQEYNAGSTIPEIRTLAPVNKYAERTGESTMLGVSKQAVFSLDPRQGGKNKLAEHKLYKTVPKFSSVTTALNGNVAVGADDGQIRLYDSISKVAKTCLPGLGDAIIGLDVTADGSYILATTKYYLLVIPTAVAGQDKSGFRQSITNKAGAPIKLALDPTDMAQYNIKSLSFTVARFNTGEGQEEYISTSTGEYVITWNFTAIKQGKRFHYKIKRCESSVVADQFLYGQQDKLVVTLPNDVYLVGLSKGAQRT